jgi:hypothetical protein
LNQWLRSKVSTIAISNGTLKAIEETLGIRGSDARAGAGAEKSNSVALSLYSLVSTKGQQVVAETKLLPVNEKVSMARNSKKKRE